MNAEQIYAGLQQEQQKLSTMPLGEESTLKQSLLVDKLIIAYYQALAVEKNKAAKAAKRKNVTSV